MISDGKGLRPLNPARAKALCKPGCLRRKPKPQNPQTQIRCSKSLNPNPKTQNQEEWSAMKQKPKK